jgi:hypothetical protein
MKKLAVKIVFLGMAFLCIGGESALSQQIIDARGTGMAFSNASDTRGLEQVGLNPATLALRNTFRFEFNLISANASLRNNSFNKHQYDKYFTTGRFLNESDKNDILNSIPDGGIRADIGGRVNTLGFYMPYFSFSLVGLGGAFAKLPEDLTELVLNGNAEEGREYKIGDVKGNGWGGIGILIGGGYPVFEGDKYWWNNVAVGATFKYIIGLGVFEILNSDGKFVNFDQSQDRYYATIDQKLEARTAEGGKGMGFDFGVTTKFKEKWTFGLTFLNLIGAVKWSSGTEKQVLSVKADSMAISDTFVETPDSVIFDTDTSYAIGDFSTSLPKVLDLSAAYQWLPFLMVTAEYEQGLSTSMAGTKKARFALGAEYTRLPILPLRTGISLGGRFGTSLAFGFGINVKNWILDIAYIGYGGIFPGSLKGMTLAATTRLRF